MVGLRVTFEHKRRQVGVVFVSCFVDLGLFLVGDEGVSITVVVDADGGGCLHRAGNRRVLVDIIMR